MESDAVFTLYAVIVFLWVLWCVQHSLFISHFFLGRVQEKFPLFMPWYRIVYNSISLLILVPLIAFTSWVGGETVFVWDGWTGVLRLLMMVTALYLFYGGAAQYDMDLFLGIRQLKEKISSQTMSSREEFATRGVFGMTRHPWYAGSILFIWSIFTSYNVAWFCAASVLTIYIVVGTYLEERKILSVYPETYTQYRRKVSMLFPWKWLRDRLSRRSG